MPEGSLQAADLVAQGQIFKSKVPPGPEDRTGISEDASKDREHGHRRSPRPAKNLKDSGAEEFLVGTLSDSPREPRFHGGGDESEQGFIQNCTDNDLTAA